MVALFPSSQTKDQRRQSLHPNPYGPESSIPKIHQEAEPVVQREKIGLWQSCLQSGKPVSMGWLLFLTSNMMDTNTLQQVIMENIQDIPMGLHWKMIILGIQGQVKPEDQVHALHIYVDKMDVAMAKPLLMEMYPSRPSLTHKFLLHICLCLVLELDMVLNIKGHKNVDKLHACQNTWINSKLILIKTWEIKLLDSQNACLHMSLQDMMMSICHPSNDKFAHFHLIDKLRWEPCHILTVLKLAKSYVHAMISALLPYLRWKFSAKEGEYASQTIAKWFKPAARSQAANAYWDPKDKYIKNMSDKLLDVMNTDLDNLYWVVDQVPPSPKQKQTQAEDKSMNDSVSTVKMAITPKHQPQKSTSNRQ